ncbi:MAG: carboxy terminal-processing peptidase [Gammaproteobacteria bacterium]
MKKKFLFIFFLIVPFLALSSKEENIEEFHASELQVQLASEIIKKLESSHLVKKDYTAIKSEAFVEFLQRLDPNKTIFTSSESDSFYTSSSLTTNINEDLDIAFNIFNQYVDRYQLRYQTQIDFLNNINDENLYSSRTLIRDLSESERLRSLQSLKNLWVDLSTNDVIQLMLSGNTLEEAKDKTKKRMNNQLNYFEQTRNEDVFNIFVNSIASIFGPHTTYMSPKNSEDFDINMSLSLEGIGALLSSDGLYTSISSLVPGGPAEKTNLIKPKDKIIGVGQDDEGKIIDVIGWRIDDVVELIRGPKGSKVRLEIIPSSALSDTETKEIQIVRNVVKLEDQAAEKKILNIKRNDIDYKVGVIELPAFYFDFNAYQKRDLNYKSSSKDVKKLLKELKQEKVDGLVIDLRNNGGGSLYEANALAHLFLGRGTTVQVKSANGNIQGLGERWGYQYFDKPLVILVNKFSASASEILAGAIQDYDRGIIVGTDTFGKGTVQRVDALSSGQIKFTESKFYRVSGSSTQNLGVQPDIILPSLFNLDELGESKLDRALMHDTIPSTSHKNFNRVSIFKSSLQEVSQVRVKDSPLFSSIAQRKRWQEENQIDKLDLNLDSRKDQKNKIEEFLLANENSLRRTLNLPTFSNYKEFMERDDDPEILDIDQEVLSEAANILLDLVELKNKPLLAMNKTVNQP